MPADDVILNLKQIVGYQNTSVLPADAVVVQRGGLGGPYYNIQASDFVANALANPAGSPLSVGVLAPSGAAGAQVFTNAISGSFGQRFWNAYIAGNQVVYLQSGLPAGMFQCDPSLGWCLEWAAVGTAGQPVNFVTAMSVNGAGYMELADQLLLGRNPTSLMEAATMGWVQTATVTSFNGRAGPVQLWLQDILKAGGAPVWSPFLQGTPMATTPSLSSCSDRIATTRFVYGAIDWRLSCWLQTQTMVNSFNGRTGDVVLTAADIEAAGATLNYAPIDSPQFTGMPTAPTAPAGTQSGQLATTAFVMNAVTESTTGVASFNGRTGAVTLQAADISGSGGALLNSPALFGTPTSPTAAPGTATTQIATTAFVGAALGALDFAPLDSPAFIGIPTAPTAANTTNNNQIATTQFVQNVLTAIDSGVTTFNGRSGAVSLLGNDISAAGGALLVSPVFTGTPQAPTAAAATSTGQIASTAFVQAAISAGAVASFNGRSGAVTLSAGDITAAGGATLASPTFTGVPAAPTAAINTSTTQLATTGFVMGQAATVAPPMDGTAAVGNGTTWARNNHVHPTDTSRAPLANPAFTGVPTAPTAANGVSTTQIATTAFVASSVAAGYVPLTGNAVMTGALTISSQVGNALSLVRNANTNQTVISFFDGVSGNDRMDVYFNHTSSTAFFANNMTSVYLTLDGSGGFNYVGGTGTATKLNGGAWTAGASDARVKTVIEDYPLGLDELMRLQPVVFVYKGNDSVERGKPSPEAAAAAKGERFVGLIAQAVEPIFPAIVGRRKGFIDGVEVDDLRTLDPSDLLYALINAVKQLAARVAALEAA